MVNAAGSAPGVFCPQPMVFAAARSVPAVSVVMTSWNDIRFLDEAVRSVLAQTMADFEFIIVDNGSVHRHKIAALTALDSRIRVLRLETDHGAAEAGNRGIALARAPLIARIDNDDRAEPEWLAAVKAALDKDSQLGLVGTWVRLISEHGDPLGIDRTPESDCAIRFTLLSHNPFYHSSTAYRRELIERVGGIEPGQNLTHDHRLWRAILPFCRARNLPRVLCNYRYNSRGLTGTSDPITKRSRSRDIRVGLWDELGLAYPLDERALADAVDDFLRDRPCQNPQMWDRVGAVIDQALTGIARKAPDFLRPGEEAECDRFAATLKARLEAGPKAPPGLAALLLEALRTRGTRRTLAAIARRLAK